MKIDAGNVVRQRLHQNLSRQGQMDSGIVLDVVVRQRALILELPPREDQALHIKRYALVLLDPRCR